MRFVHLSGRDLSHGTLAAAFSFPPYYGSNLDALFDCLTEIAQHTMIVLSDSESADARTLRVIRAAVAQNPRLCLMTM